MVVMVMSHVCYLRDPTQQDLSTHVPYPYIYVSHVIQILKNPPEYTM